MKNASFYAQFAVLMGFAFVLGTLGGSAQEKKQQTKEDNEPGAIKVADLQPINGRKSNRDLCIVKIEGDGSIGVKHALLKDHQRLKLFVENDRVRVLRLHVIALFIQTDPSLEVYHGATAF